MLQKLKNKIINQGTRFYFIKILLSYLFFLKDSSIRRKFSKTKLSLVYFSYLTRFYSHCLRTDTILIINKLREIKIVLFLIKKVALYSYFRRFIYITKLPENLRRNENYIFKNKEFFYCKPCKIIPIKNSYLYITSYLGLIFKNFCINKKSYHRSLDKRNSISKSYYHHIFEAYTEKTFSKEDSILKLNPEKKYILIHHWFNYYHWFTETLYRLFSAKDEIQNYVLLLPDGLKKFSFVMESLSTLPELNIEYVPDNSLIQFEKLYLVTHKTYCNNYEPHILCNIRKHFTDYINRNNIVSPINNERVYAIRSQNSGRSIANEEQFYKILKKYDFELVDFEKYNFNEQVAIAQQTRYFVGAHGAALTNILWLPENAHVFELHKKEVDRHDHISIVYWRLAAAMGHKYYYQINDYIKKEHVKNNKSASYFQFDYFNAHYRLNIDLDIFESNIKKFLDKY